LFAFALVLGAMGAGFGALPATWLRWLAASLVVGLAAALLRRPAQDPGVVLASAAEPLQALSQATENKEDGEAEGEHEATRAGGLARELRAILVLYVACSALPLLVGLALAN